MAITGRPLKFKNVQELQSKIDAYFAQCESRGSQPFITELALWLDTSRDILIDYEHREKFSNAIKRAKLKCEVELERLILAGKVNPTGAIFSLKNNYGWRDKAEIDHTTKGKELPAPIFGGNSVVPSDDSDQ